MSAIATAAETPSPPPDLVERLYATGYLHLQAGNHPTAAGAFSLMLTVAPQDPRAWLALGETHRLMGSLVVAAEILTAGSVACHPSPSCLEASGVVLRALGEEELAEAACACAERLRGGHSPSLPWTPAELFPHDSLCHFPH